MKNVTLSIVALLLAGLVLSCQEDDQVGLPASLSKNDGDITVLMNDEDIPNHFTNRVAAVVGSATSCYPEMFSLGSLYAINGNINRMSFSINNVPLAEGRYAIDRVEYADNECGFDQIPAYFSTTIADGDVVGDKYLPVEGEDNYIVITSFNEATGEIAGTFQMTMAIEMEGQNQKYSGLADTLRLTQGVFSATTSTQ